ncbi:MAG: DUF2236 domain-containing protein [Chloroflexi bacterium]|nr:DUF2236 domain-containing protein [Chloroflexota bacterium]
MRKPDRPGLYTPDDMLWRVNRELVLLLSGTRALLLEIAHPLVAAGVAEHSDFKRRPLKRLFRTVNMMQRMSFGEDAIMRGAARGVNRCHRPVNGVLAEPVGHYEAGTAYDADDPALRLWVWATLVDSCIVFYDALVHPMSPADREAYYRDSVKMGRMFGVTPDLLPPDYPAFDAYMQETIYGGTLAVGETARAIWRAIVRYPVFGQMVRLASFVSIGLMPDHLREAFDLPWGPARERRLQWFLRTAPRVRRFLPTPIAVHPQAWLRERSYV